MTDLHSGSRSERLDQAIHALLAQTPEIEAAAVVSFDGLPMAAALPPSMDEDRVAAMSAALLSLGERATVGLRRGELSQVFRVPTPGWDLIETVWDKRLTYRTCARLGIPTPRTWYLDGGRGVDSVDGEPPFAVKPAVRHPFVTATKAKAWRADSHEQLRALVGRAGELIPAEQVLVQEVVPGDGSRQYAYCALFKDGHALATMVVQRLRQHPPEFGRASTHVRTTESEEVEELAQRFLRAVGYYGLVEVEFKQDPRTGTMKLLDVNARPWGYHALGQAAGVDFPYLLYADQVGTAPQPVRAQSGITWTRLITDVPVGLLEVTQGRLRPGQYVRSLLSTSTESVFCRDDLVPAAVEIALLPYLMRVRGF